jgi:hypothetical protein
MICLSNFEHAQIAPANMPSFARKDAEWLSLIMPVRGG